MIQNSYVIDDILVDDTVIRCPTGSVVSPGGEPQPAESRRDNVKMG